MELLVGLALSAVLLAGLYATMAYGLGLIYGVLRVVNLTHGGVLMAGAYLGWWLYTRLGIDPYLAIPIVVAASFAFGVALFAILFMPAYLTAAVGFVLLVVVLILRPGGLFGQRVLG